MFLHDTKILYLLSFILGVYLILTPNIKINKRRLKKGGFLRTLENLSRTKIFKHLQYPVGHKEYINIEKKLKQAGFKNLTVGTYQMIRYLFQLVLFILFTAISYTNAINTLLNMEKLEGLIEFAGENSNLIQKEINVNVGVILGFSFVGYFLPDLVLKVLIAYRNARGNKEVMMLLTYVVMMLKSKRSVKYILLSLKERAKIYQEPLEIAVNGYSKEPSKTLEELKTQIGHPQFQKICIALQQALERDPKTSIKYLENHRILAKELNRINLKEKNMRKSMFGLILLIVPLLVFGLVGGYPWLIYALRQLDASVF